MDVTFEQEFKRERRPRPTVKSLVERRFPLHLHPSILSVRRLYEEAKASYWDPERDIPWGEFQAGRYSTEQLAAARLSWSRRAWCEFTGIAETPALLIRFCLEHEGESDPKMFLTMRGSEEVWHLECCYRFADLVGGYIEEPASDDYAALFNQGLFRQAFDPTVSPDAYVAAHVAAMDGIDLELYRGRLRTTTDPVAAAIGRRLVEDKERHVAFGWAYLDERSATWSDAARAEITEEVNIVLRALLFRGCISLAFTPSGRAEDIECADRITREAGLGASTPEEDGAVIKACVADMRNRFRRMGIDVSEMPDPQGGAF